MLTCLCRCVCVRACKRACMHACLLGCVCVMCVCVCGHVFVLRYSHSLLFVSSLWSPASLCGVYFSSVLYLLPLLLCVLSSSLALHLTSTSSLFPAMSLRKFIDFLYWHTDSLSVWQYMNTVGWGQLPPHPDITELCLNIRLDYS